MVRKLTLGLLVIALTSGMYVAPAVAADNDGLEDPNECYNMFGPNVPSGGVVVLPPYAPTPSGQPSLPPTGTGPAGPMMQVYLCVAGTWIRVSGLEVPLLVTPDSDSVTVDEGSTATMAGTYQSAAALVAFNASAGTAAPATDPSWDWSLRPDDGPVTQQVLVTATADDKQATAVFDLHVTNVAPTAKSLSPSTATALVGQPVTFTGTASDPSSADTAAGFTWSIDGGATQSFDACGTHTVTGSATDKDGGTSEPITSGPVQVLEAEFRAPLVPGARNIVRAGQVVPVKVSLGCGGAVANDLAPTITLLTGNADPTTTADDPASVVPASDASGDTSGVMRPIGDSFIYNLKVPKVATGSLLTVRVRPTSGSLMQVVLQVR